MSAYLIDWQAGTMSCQCQRYPDRVRDVRENAVMLSINSCMADAGYNQNRVILNIL